LADRASRANEPPTMSSSHVPATMPPLPLEYPGREPIAAFLD
jgi:hypothetical protein